MGSKAGILDFIIPRILKRVEEGDVVFDIMAGTHSVGFAVKPRQTVYANDVQAYSYVIGQALIENNSVRVSREEATRQLDVHINENLGRIEYLIRSGDFGRPGSEEFYQSIRRLYRSNPRRNPYILFTAYFTNTYFSETQCKQIDSIRYALDQVDNQYRRALYLCALLYAISSAAATTGHFAQYRPVRKDVIDLRQANVLEIFLRKCDELDVTFNGRNNRCFNRNYHDFFEERSLIRDVLEKVNLIYLDPPYSPAQYSRFYHIPETLVLYDYPVREYKGQYRHDRHWSDFCRKSKAEKEFEFAIRACAEYGIKLAISYKSNGIVSISTLRNLCAKYYSHVDQYETPHRHSMQGRQTDQGKNSTAVVENLLICEASVLARAGHFI
jgi:adenine-specific DNA-methyltransferase